ncbi:c-type cytochrome [Shewanella sp. SR41-2]|nr:c-type cytochrome [Shewanella sp. SR41-2]
MDPNNEWVYFGALSGEKLYRVHTQYLLDAKLSANMLRSKVEFYANKPVSDGITIDNGGNIYVTDISNNAVGYIDTDRQYHILHQDSDKFSWWQDNAFVGQADVYLSYERHDEVYADGRTISLKKPIFAVENPYDAPGETKQSANITSNLLQDDVLMGWRNGMPVFGLGLLEAIPEASILANVDADDSNKDDISGRANWVFDAIKAQNGDSTPVSLGRFGWKANTPSVRVQSLGALRGDIGITNSLFPDESIVGTSLHDSYLTRTGFVDTGEDVNGAPEASAEFSDSVVFYAETLAVPARRNVDKTAVREGARLFEQLNCSSCHTPSFVTKTSGDIGGLPMSESLKGQTIYPFSDMLLHDMGEGLADGRPDFLADGNEWRTRPLWGIGLTQTVNPQAGFLHDGRAATLEEAILWHDGESKTSKQDFMALTQTERDQVIAFLQSL